MFGRGINLLLLVSFILFCLTQVQSQADETVEDPAATEEPEDPEATETPEVTEGPGEGTGPPPSGMTRRRPRFTGSTKYTTTHKYNTRRKYTKKYGQDMVGDYSRGRDYHDRSREKYHNKGIDPDTYGQDMADRKDIYEDKDLMVASINVWIKSAHRWNQPDKHPYRANRYNKDRYSKDSKKKYSKEDDYKGKDKYSDSDSDSDEDYKGKDKDYDKKGGYRKGKDMDYDKKDGKYKGKDNYKKISFPVRVYKSYKKFPRKRLPTLFSALPSVPIFYDKITYQTFIYCPTGHFLILPPLINFFGQRFAVAQLIKWGYASLVSSGIPPAAGFNALPLVTPPGGPGAPPPPQLPFNPNNGQFNGGVTTNFGSFRPQ